MNLTNPPPADPDGPVCGRRSADAGPPVHAAAPAAVAPSNDAGAAAADRGLDWAALAGIAEYESWLRHLG